MRRVPAVAAIVIGARDGDRPHRHVRLHEGERRREPHRRCRGSVGNEGIVRFRNDVTTVDAGEHRRWSNRSSPRSPRSSASARRSSSSVCGPPTPRRPAAFLDQRDAIFASIDTTVSNLEAHQDDYDAADAIPTSLIPLSVMPWFALAFGLLLIGLGVWAWVQPGRASAAVVALAGAILITFTLVAQLPSKGAKAEQLLDSLNIDEEIATRTRTEFETFKAGTEDLKEVFVEFAGRAGRRPKSSARRSAATSRVGRGGRRVTTAGHRRARPHRGRGGLPRGAHRRVRVGEGRAARDGRRGATSCSAASSCSPADSASWPTRDELRTRSARGRCRPPEDGSAGGAGTPRRRGPASRRCGWWRR